MTREPLYLTIAEVLEMQRHLINEFGGLHGVRDAGLLASAVFRPLHLYPRVLRFLDIDQNIVGVVRKSLF